MTAGGWRVYQGVASGGPGQPGLPALDARRGAAASRCSPGRSDLPRTELLECRKRWEEGRSEPRWRSARDCRGQGARRDYGHDGSRGRQEHCTRRYGFDVVNPRTGRATSCVIGDFTPGRTRCCAARRHLGGGDARPGETSRACLLNKHRQRHRYCRDGPDHQSKASRAGRPAQHRFVVRRGMNQVRFNSWRQRVMNGQRVQWRG